MPTRQLEPSAAPLVPPALLERLTAARARVAPRVPHLVVAAGRAARNAFDRICPSGGPVEDFVPGETRLALSLWRPAILGFIASVAIVLGASQANSPFTLKSVAGASPWFFGIPSPSPTGQFAPPGQGLFLGVGAVYAGMVLMVCAWYDIVRVCIRYRGIPVAKLVPIFVIWVLPLLVVAPLFSRDVYSYAAQGEMMTRHLNPYEYGPSVLGYTPFHQLTDPLWGNVSSPYGPVFLTLAGWIVALTGHNVLLSVEGLRLLALAGTALFAFAVPVIARSFGRDGSTAFALAALNPLVLLYLVGGAHNDALMLGFLVPGYALARRGHPVLGIVCCTFGAMVKIPAMIGVVYIGWEWLGHGRSLSERLRPVATALIIAGATMAATSELVGFGFGWVGGLSNPDTVRSWLDPATGLGLFAGRLVHTVGLGNHTHVLLTLARGSALLLAGLISLRLLLRSEALGSLRALGWSLIAIVLLGPVVQPWYITWGFVFLAPIAEGRVRRMLILASGVALFLQLPGGRVLLNEIGNANPMVVAVASAALLGIAGLIVLPRFKKATGARALA